MNAAHDVVSAAHWTAARRRIAGLFVVALSSANAAFAELPPDALAPSAASSAAVALPVTAAAPDSAVASAFDHSTWDLLLATYVDEHGLVAYRALQSKDVPTLQKYLDALAKATPDAWPKSDQIAFWVNAYNAGMWSAVLQGKLAESLVSRGELLKGWTFPVAGKRRTADEIENEILKRFGDPRTHFALVPLSVTAPPLRREAYRGDKLDAQLDDQMHRFMDDPTRNILDPAKPKLQLSMIFVWYKDEFAKAASGSPEDFAARYVTRPELRDWMRTGKVPVQHFNYDWTLNTQPNQRPWIEWGGGSKP